MKQLNTLLEKTESRDALVGDCVALIDSEVKAKGGLTGIAVKTAYGVVKAIKPTIISESVNGLLDEFVGELQPHYEKYQQEGAAGTLEAYLKARADAVAESMLAVTDRRAQRANNKTLVKAYQKLRPKGKAHVLVAVPGVGRVLDRHVAQI